EMQHFEMAFQHTERLRASALKEGLDCFASFVEVRDQVIDSLRGSDLPKGGIIIGGPLMKVLVRVLCSPDENWDRSRIADLPQCCHHTVLVPGVGKRREQFD